MPWISLLLGCPISSTYHIIRKNMIESNVLPLALGLLIFSFIVTSILLVPFIDFLYKVRLTRRKEAPKRGKVPLFDKLHDKKAGTPIGGGILIIIVVSLLFSLLFPLSSHMGVYIKSSFNFRNEIMIIFFYLFILWPTGIV